MTRYTVDLPRDARLAARSDGFDPDAAPPVADHEIVACLPFLFHQTAAGDVEAGVVAPLLARTVGALLDSLPQVDAAGLDEATRGAAVFRRTTRPNAPLDLHPQVADVLYGQPIADDAPGRRFRGMPPLELTPEAKAALRTADGGSRLSLRLWDTWVLPLRIIEADLYLFGSNVGMLVLHIRFDESGRQPSLAAFNRCVQLLGRGKKLGWKPCICATTKQPPTLWLEDIAAGLAPAVLGTTSSAVAPIHAPRIFTMAAVRLLHRFPADDQRQRWGYLLSRGVGTDQEPVPERMLDGFTPMRGYTTFCIAAEGGALLLEPDDGGETSSHIRRYIHKSFRRIYLPIALAAYHEYELLLHLGRAVEMPVDVQNPDDAVMDRLRDFQARLLDFRLNFRFPHVSRIGSHNLVYEAWREALRLDRLSAELTTDVDEVARYLEYHRERRDALEQRAITHQQTAYGILFGGMVLAAGLAGMNFHEITTDPGLRLSPKNGWQAFRESYWAAYILGGALIFAGLVGLQALRYHYHALQARRQAKPSKKG